MAKGLNAERHVRLVTSVICSRFVTSVTHEQVNSCITKTTEIRVQTPPRELSWRGGKGGMQQRGVYMKGFRPFKHSAVKRCTPC
ncbi:hypothetical protein J6590_016742 [Homalodisca vitripennis]|nr:hypothetical protein J6590_016742 [Homalodisca vitripennis]